MGRSAAWAASALACAGIGAEPHGLPTCTEEKPAADAECELDEAVVDWKRDALMTLWGYVGSGLRRLPVSIDFDAAARVQAVCLEPGASVPRAQRQNVARGMRALESMRHTPSCLAGTRLSLAEEWAEQARRTRGRSQTSGPEHRCSVRDPPCTGWNPPVCALRRDGRWVEYDDRCEACRDSYVVGYDAQVCGLR